MKNIRKTVLILAGLLLLMHLCYGCVSEAPPATEAPTEPTVDPRIQAYKEDPTAFVKFSKSTGIREWVVPISDLMNYESMYPDCNGTWFRDRLTGEDLLIYNSYLFAMENGYIDFTLYVADSDKDFSYIREALSLDSPFLEQNFSEYETIFKQPINYRGKSIIVSIEQFTNARWEMKMEALDKCRKIVAGIPETCVTQTQKMEYLYEYVCDHVEYIEYEDMADEDYFYDAVCKGMTVCDGYSNMLNLLFNLIGVECCEAMGSNVEDFGEATEEEMANADGHTWVVAKLDGQFYNFDPTFEDTDGKEGTKRYFGYSDDLVSVQFLDCEELRPKCTDTSRDFPYVDMILESTTDNNGIKSLAKLIGERAKKGEHETTVAVRKAVTEKEGKTFLQKVVNRTKSVQSISCNWDRNRGSAVFYILI